MQTQSNSLQNRGICDSTLCPDSQSFATYLMEQCQNRDIPLETEQLLQYATSTYSIFSRIESFLKLLSYLREGLGRNAREKKRRDKGTHSMQEAPSGKHGGPTLPPSLSRSTQSTTKTLQWQWRVSARPQPQPCCSRHQNCFHHHHHHHLPHSPSLSLSQVHTQFRKHTPM